MLSVSELGQLFKSKTQLAEVQKPKKSNKTSSVVVVPSKEEKDL